MFLVTLGRLETMITPLGFWVATALSLSVFLGVMYLLIRLQCWLDRPGNVELPMMPERCEAAVKGEALPAVTSSLVLKLGSLQKLRDVPQGWAIELNGQRAYTHSVSDNAITLVFEDSLARTFCRDEADHVMVRLLGPGKCRTTITVNSHGYYH